MHKTDSADFTSRVKLLLKLMTSSSTKESTSTEDDDYFISSDESDISTDDNDEDQSDEIEQNLEKENNYNKTVHLNKFFEEHVENTRKHLSSSVHNDSVWNDFVFEDKMYRVIPLKLSEKLLKSKGSILSKKNR
ncbi:PREDICTED: uncharacterized protein LOC108579746 [Habropoda laboriosa]|uniref:uncharacterized protein LOC108579746 n=1 Tax=Habropoda laboriosa TaxID=597456 RepID=UPI00083D6F7B|nr:PREDICTED: uncharacterized protein LOC108579746 [Habropoda laboriosa]